MGNLALYTRGLSKQYRIGARRRGYQTLRESLMESMRAPVAWLRRPRRSADSNKDDRWIWALSDVSLDVRHGDIVGIVGRNGAGKSTLLRVLSRITEPTSGYAEIHGRVGSLLEVGTGFHPELSGRENVYLNGVILGMRRSEINRKFDEIVAFAEVDKFIDTPVKHYSSGMQLRLAFSVAAHLEPEVLVVDEVLAVGDASFQRKCTGKMGDIAREGRTVLFVSHNLAAVRQLCRSAVLLQSGQVVSRGTTEEVLRQYLATAFEDCGADLTAIRDRKGRGELRFSYIRFEDDRGQTTSGLAGGQPGRIVLGVTGRKPLQTIRCCVTVRDELSQRILYLKSTYVDAELPQLAPGQELVCHIPRVHLGPGQYRVEIWMTAGTVMQDHLSDAGGLLVTDGNFFGTGQSVVPGFQVALMDFSWQIRDPRYEERSSRSDGAFPESSPLTQGAASGSGASAVESVSPEEALRLSSS